MEHNNNTDTGDTTVAVSKAPALPPSIHTVREPYVRQSMCPFSNINNNLKSNQFADYNGRIIFAKSKCCPQFNCTKAKISSFKRSNRK